MPKRSKLAIGLVVVIVLIGAAMVANVALAPVLFPTPTPTPTRTPSPTPTNTPTPTPTATPTPTSTPTPPPTNTPTATATPVPTETPLPTSTPVPTEPPAPAPTSAAEVEREATPAADCSAPIPAQAAIRGRRIITYYGTPLGPGLGILGRYDIGTTLAQLNEQAQAYRELDPCVEVVPGFHMVVTIADDFPGPDGDYNHRVAHETIQPWIDSIAAAGGLSVLDIQLGRSTLEIELASIEPLIRQPTVHLAIDPEFIVGEGEVPGTNLGRIEGEAINQAQLWLHQIAEQTGERKILVIHQFDDRMLVNKDAILDYPLVDLVWDADGFGGPGAKTGDYQQYRDEGFEFGGFKIFYRYDTPVMTPGQVMALDPPPAYVIYQ